MNQRETISEILAKARIQASLDEPTRPTTPMTQNKFEYVAPLTHIATIKRLKHKNNQVKSPHDKKKLNNISSLVTITNQMRIDILNQLDDLNTNQSKIFEEDSLENLAEVIERYLKTIKSENIPLGEGIYHELYKYKFILRKFDKH